MAVYKMTAYPKTVELVDGQTITIRPMDKGDGDALLSFFLRIPEEDRFYLKEDVTSPEVIQRWAENLDYSRALPLLALDGNKIIADGTLHRRRAGSMQHVGEIRIVVEPKYRYKGMRAEVMRELRLIAKDSDLEKVILELVAAEQAPAIRTAEALGFVKLATLPNYVRNIHGSYSDLLVMELPLGKWQEWWEF